MRTRSTGAPHARQAGLPCKGRRVREDLRRLREEEAKHALVEHDVLRSRLLAQHVGLGRGKDRGERGLAGVHRALRRMEPAPLRAAANDGPTDRERPLHQGGVAPDVVPVLLREARDPVGRLPRPQHRRPRLAKAGPGPRGAGATRVHRSKGASPGGSQQGLVEAVAAQVEALDDDRVDALAAHFEARLMAQDGQPPAEVLPPAWPREE
eukprot:2410890-Lingulodinium_polyedra.AAC.1